MSSKQEDSAPRSTGQKFTNLPRTEPEVPPLIVGIGASAGGLRPLEQFFLSLPRDLVLAVVVVQHQSASINSCMAQLLQRVTTMSVAVAEQGEEIVPGSVYLAPPGVEISVRQGRFQLVDGPAKSKVLHLIDELFLALADEYRERAVGIVLSGTGNDGAHGVREIANAGGLVLVQDPKTARFSEMPLAALRTGHTYQCLAPNEMGRTLRGHRSTTMTETLASPVATPEDALTRLQVLLSEAHDVEFSEDARFIFEQQVHDRITLLQLSSVSEYVGLLERHSEEVDELYRRFQTELVQSKLTHLTWMGGGNSDASFVVNAEGKVVYANRAFTRRLGLAEDDWLSLNVVAFDDDLDDLGFRNLFDSCRSSGGMILRSVHRRDDGRVLPTTMALTYVQLSGRPHLYCVIRDNDDVELHNRYRDASRSNQSISLASNGIVICDAALPDRPITFANQSFYELTGYSAEETLGRNCRFLQGRNTSATAIAKLKSAIAEERPCRVLIENYRKDGTAFWNHLFLTPVRNRHGKTTHFVGVQNDVTTQLQIGESARQSERTIRLLLDSTVEGIAGINSRGFCTFCNSSAVTMLGYSTESDLIGRRLQLLVQPPVFDGMEMEQVLSTGVGFEDRTRDFVRADGSSLPVVLRCHPIHVAGECVGAVVTFVDDSERRQHEQQLEEARTRAEFANEAKSAFLANVSHELRTPLAAILGFAKIIEDEYQDEGLHQKVRAIHRNGDYLLKLLGDILDLSRIEAGKLELRCSVVDLQEFFNDIYRTMKMRTESGRTKLTVRAAGPLPATITTDPARLRQVIVNLVANAIKFTADGQVDVTVRFAAQSNEQPTLRVEVSDSGIGIDEKQLSRLFEPFTQADSTINERFGGTGLGLNISRRLVHLLGGQINATSTEGVGSTFTVVVPVDPVGRLVQLNLEEDRRSESQDRSDPDPSLGMTGGQRILIADDMRDVREIAAHFLRKAGAQIAFADNGQAAVEAVVNAVQRGEPYALVLMDLQMPVLDGASAVRAIRELDVDIPIVALTADAMKGTRERLLALGFTAYLTKPIHSEELLRTVARLVSPTVS